MSDNSSPTTIVADDSVRNLAGDLGIDYRSLFIGLGKATVSGLVGFSTNNPAAFGNAIGNVISAFSAFGERSDIHEKVGDDARKLAWLLVHESLLSAITDLVSDHDARFRAAYQDSDELPAEEDVAQHIEESLDLTLTETEIKITPSFFDRPTDLGIIEPLQQDLEAWFKAVGVPEGEAISISIRLPSYFRTALINEWREHSAEYQRLKDAVDVPFVHAEKRTQAWETYRAHLQKQIDEPVFGEAVSLRQIYVWPRAFVQVPTDETDQKKPPNSQASTAAEREMPNEMSAKRRVSWLRESVLEWLQTDDESDAIRIIKGDPGTGKSSFSKMLAAELAGQDNHTVVYAPLRRLDATKKMTESIREFVSVPNHPLEGFDPFGEMPLLLILDGLDELSKQGRVGADVAREFVREIDRSLRGLNQGGVAVRVLLSGRKIAADAGAEVLRDPTKVFNIIPYTPEGSASDYEDPNHLAFNDGKAIDQRDEWWRKYGEASGSDYSGGMPTHLRRGKLGDITKQPLLNYLVALAYEDDETQFTENASLNTLYAQLLDGVYRRDYDFAPHPGTEVVSSTSEGTKKEGFIRVLEEIALDSWHSDGRTTTVASIKQRCERENLVGHFEEVREKLATGISQLLAAFYFRKTGRTPQGEDTFEFTHKTFAEYLTARRIVRAVEEIHEERERNEEKGGTYGINIEEALSVWIEVCGPSAMDSELLQFIENEVRLEHEDKECAEVWRETFADFIRYVLRHDLPMHKIDNSLDYKSEKVQARNAEEALLAVVHSCCRALTSEEGILGRRVGSQAVDVFDDLPDGSAGDWIRRLQSPLTENSRALYRQLLPSIVWSNSNLSHSFLDTCYFVDADLRGADMRDVTLRFSNAHWVDLREANLMEANLSGSILSGAKLQKADCRGANLRGVYINDTDLREADLRGADLRGLSLPYLMAQDIRHRDTGPGRVNPQEIDLHEEDLRNASWRITRFEGIKIDESTQMSAALRHYITSQSSNQGGEMSEASDQRN